MKAFQVLMLTAAIATLSAVAVSAHPVTPRIDRREARQHARIERGVRSGALTPAETRRLVAGQRHVHRMERRAKADGFVSARERARIGHAQNRESRRIRVFEHNGAVR
jgi:uncharacterized membrane protein YebE (DUF533 family)